MDITTIEGVFRLSSLVEYEEGKIATTIVERTDGMLLALKAIDAGLTLPEHPAPGNAIVSVIEGKAIANFRGQKFEMERGQSIVFPKGELHSVFAPERTKIAILAAL